MGLKSRLLNDPRNHEKPTTLKLLIQKEFGFTEFEVNAIHTAYTMGYFNIPHNCTLKDIGEKMGVSASAAQTRLTQALQKVTRYIFE